MVIFFNSRIFDPPVTMYMGRDKVENEELLRYGLSTDIWFHVDKLSSAHVYLRRPPSQSFDDWDSLPTALVNDAAQLVKANSIEGNKKDNITVIYTPFSNLKKTGDMAVGQVSFHSDKTVKRGSLNIQTCIYLSQAKLIHLLFVREVDHETERQERLREEGRRKKLEAVERNQLEADRKKAWGEEKKQRSYEGMYDEEHFAEREGWSDDDFM
ncbi:MAG: hypothetical protein TREMPRED_000125 [Tremellales sp. Tagirdzhanova-0007]|nr:MAG: hypothetical protein TREMPRED_000125 [Tremellales sp. Tagirdzhanova-0007]